MLATVALIIMVTAGECARRDEANWQQGFRVGVEAAIEGGTYVRWGECLERGRVFKCARTSEGNLIEVRMR